MPVKPWMVRPKQSLGIFEGLGNVMDARAERQQTLEDRLAQQDARRQQGEVRTLEMKLKQAELDAMSRPKEPTVVATREDPVTGEVWDRLSNGKWRRAVIEGAAAPAAPVVSGTHANDDIEHGGPAAPQQAAPAPVAPTLRLGVKAPPKKEAVLREVGGDLYDVSEPTKPVLVMKAPPKKDNGAALTKELQREKSLRDEYMADPHVKNAYGVAGAAAQIRAAAENVDNPQGDLDIIYQVVKIRDPNSVVREGEIDLQKAARSLGTQVAAAWQKAKAGRLLTPEERAAIVSLVSVKEDALRSQIAPVQAEFGRQSRQYGVDSSFVAPSPFAGSSRANRPAGGAPTYEEWKAANAKRKGGR